MFCPKCGAEAQGGRFCRSCGAQLAAAQDPGQAPAEEHTPQQQQTPMSAQPQPGSAPQAPQVPPGYAPMGPPPGPPPKPKRKGWKLGCLIVLVVILVLCGCTAAMIFGLPERLGLVESTFDQRFPAGSSSMASGFVMDALAESEQTTMGIDVYVLPVEGEDYTVAYVALDETEGYEWSGNNDDPIVSAFVDVATSEAAVAAGIERVAVEYVDDEGVTLFVVTAASADIVAYADGSLSREEFLQRVDGQGDLARVMRIRFGWVRELQ